MVEISKLESRAEVEISKLKVEITRLKQRALKANDRRLKNIAYMREYRRKLKAKGSLGPEGSSQPLARETAASHRTGIRSIIIQVY